jgi:FtsP/CotA-like multicopper oxidase with cupredoxin domain
MRRPNAFHIGGVSFRILDRDGRPPEAHEPGLRDTVLVRSRRGMLA